MRKRAGGKRVGGQKPENKNIRGAAGWITWKKKPQSKKKGIGREK